HVMKPLSILLLAITLAGCNSAQVVRSNIERTVENKGKREPPAWPAHPYAVTASATNDDRVPTENPSDDVDDEEEIIQAGAQQPMVGNSPVHAAPSGAAGSGTITGRVVDSSGRLQPSVSIMALPTRRPGGRRVETMTDQQGNFALRGLE